MSMLKMTQQAKDTTEKIRLFTGLTYQQVKDVLESFYTLVTINYLEGKTTHIPYLGEISIEYKGDEIKAGGREAILHLSVDADSMLKRVIGQIQDGDETEVERIFLDKIKMELDTKANGD